MDGATGIALAALISLSGLFNDGLTALQQKQYKLAVTKLSEVYEKDIPGNSLRNLALYFRAQAYLADGKNNKALDDLKHLGITAADTDLREAATKLYLQNGGDPDQLRPAEALSEVWSKFVKAAKQGDNRAALKLCTGSWHDHVLRETQTNPTQWKESFSLLPYKPAKETYGKGKEFGTASLQVDVDGNGHMVEVLFTLDKSTNHWLIRDFKP